MTTTVRPLLERHPTTVQAMRHNARQRNGPLAPFFRGLLIGAALVVAISLVIG